MRRDVSDFQLIALGAVTAALALAIVGSAGAQGTLLPQNAEMPGFLFVIDLDESMTEHWSDNPQQPTRWEVVRDAVTAAVNSAPADVQFAVVGTHESSLGWLPISSFDHSNLHLTRAMNERTLRFSDHGSVASAYDGVLDTYLSRSRQGFRLINWLQMPFTEACSHIEVVIISHAAGEDRCGDRCGTCGNSYNVNDELFSGDVQHSGVCEEVQTCERGADYGISLLDDVAYHAANTDLNTAHGGSQTVRTHTILVDALEPEAARAEDVFISASEISGGLYTRAEAPSDVAIGISLAMTDALQSVLNVSTAVTTAVGHRMFRTWTEIPGELDGVRGAPLHRGHLEAFQLVNKPTDSRYGEILGGPLWDAADLLARRSAEPGAENSNVFGSLDPSMHERTLFTNDGHAGLDGPRSLVPFDATRVHELGQLMLEGYEEVTPVTFACPDFPTHDFNQDCSVDQHDAQLAIDFLRGVPEATFAGSTDGTRRERGSWRMGGMFLSMPAFSDAHSRSFTNDRPMVAFQQKLAEHDSVVYATSNDGFLHAFKVPYLDDTGDGWEDYTVDPLGGWELWGYIPRHLLDRDAEYHSDVHSALNLMLDGESHLNDGSVNLSDVWMDGVPNHLDAECAEADADGRVDADGCEYHRVLVASMGMGSRYHYAIDVTHPHQPLFMWEWIGDQDGWRKGQSTGTPILATVYHAETATDVPVVLWSSGTVDPGGTEPTGGSWWEYYLWWRNRSGVGSRWYMFDLVNPSNAAFSQVGYRVDSSLTPFTSGHSDPRYYTVDPAAGLFGTPAAVDYDEDGNVDALYMGDRHGYLYKVLLEGGSYTPGDLEVVGDEDGSTCMFHAPASYESFRALFEDDQAVYYRPSVARDDHGRVRVSWGTGWPGNVAEPYASGHVFSVLDGERAGDEWSCQPATVSTCGAAFDPMQLAAGEKLVGPVMTHGGRILFTTYVADNAAGGPACGVGHARIYAITLNDCLGGFAEGRDWGPDDRPVTDSTYVEIEGIPSRWSFANEGIYLSIVMPDGSLESIGPIRPEPTEEAGVRVAYTNWRHVL